jgi:TetR/AcrR family transcriptional regulator
MTRTTPNRLARLRRPAASVEQIRGAAIELFAQRGFAATSMRDIARVSGMSLAGLYHHFAGKDELLYRIEEDAYKRLMAPLRQMPPGSTPVQRIEQIIHNHVVFFAGQITEMKVLSHELRALPGERGRRVRRMRHEYFALCLQAVRGLLRGKGRHAPDARAATMCLFGMINWIYTWYRPERDGDPEALAKLMTQIVMRGLVPATTVHRAATGQNKKRAASNRR